MAIRERLSGNEAVAHAIKQINPDVMPAFPITPSTEIPQFVSTFISNGEIDTEFIPVESEHSAMSAAIGAEAAGGRGPPTTTHPCSERRGSGLPYTHSHIIMWYGSHVGGALCGSVQSSSTCPRTCKQSTLRPYQHQL